MKAKSQYDLAVRPFFKQIEWWLKKGAINNEIAKRLGVPDRTFRKYIHEQPKLKKLIATAKADPDYEVENSLFKRANGYSYTEKKKIYSISKRGIKTLTRYEETVKFVVPDVSACIFWLKNRKPDDWREKHEIDLLLGFNDIITALPEKYQKEFSDSLMETARQRKSDKRPGGKLLTIPG